MGIWIYQLTFLSLAYLFPADEGKDLTWYKGNLHTHSYWSDGDEFPEMVIDWYKTHGYHFLALSEHNILAMGEKWVKIPDSRMYLEGFDRYSEKFGPGWVVSKIDSGRTHVKLKTYPEYKPLFEDERFIILPSEEITDSFEGKPLHLNATNIESLIAPQHGKSVFEVLQNNIDAVNAQRRQTGIPMFPHINHPNFGFAITVEDMIGLRGERFFEVYNGHPYVHNYGDSLHPGTEEMWDRINIAYLSKGVPPMYGLATDDSHNYHSFGTAFSNAGRGWVMVQAETLSAAAIVDALERGRFYASTGVTLQEISIGRERIRVRVLPEDGVRYKIEFIGARKGDFRSMLLQSTNGSEASFRLSKDYLFVRARIVSNKAKANPFQAGDFETAWTQPVVFK
ncbi:MAG TPA: histidinol-phosphatase [Chryseosolibacter sp.]|nr:histidinol-phosphatase [Chryseosolibacter sp.]